MNLAVKKRHWLSEPQVGPHYGSEKRKQNIVCSLLCITNVTMFIELKSSMSMHNNYN